MNTQEYHIKRNAIYQKMVEAKLIEDTDDNFQTFDTILGESLDVDWNDRGIIIVGVGSESQVQDIAKQIAMYKTGQQSKVVIIDDSPPIDSFNDALMKISNYKVEDYLLSIPKYDGTSTSKYNKPNNKNWKK